LLVEIHAPDHRELRFALQKYQAVNRDDQFEATVFVEVDQAILAARNHVRLAVGYGIDCLGVVLHLITDQRVALPLLKSPVGGAAEELVSDPHGSGKQVVGLAKAAILAGPVVLPELVVLDSDADEFRLAAPGQADYHLNSSLEDLVSAFRDIDHGDLVVGVQRCGYKLLS